MADTTRYTDAMPITVEPGTADKETVIKKATDLYTQSKQHGDTIMMEVAEETLKKHGAEIPT